MSTLSLGVLHKILKLRLQAYFDPELEVLSELEGTSARPAVEVHGPDEGVERHQLLVEAALVATLGGGLRIFFSGGHLCTVPLSRKQKNVANIQ